MARGRMIRPKATASRCARNFIPGTSYISLEGRDTHIERKGMEKNKKYEIFICIFGSSTFAPRACGFGARSGCSV